MASKNKTTHDQHNYKYHNPHEKSVTESYLNQAIQMTTIEELKDFMTEDKQQYHDQETKKNEPNPKGCDYGACDGDITKCNSIQRITYLLQYYDEFQESNNHVTIEQTAPLYEYISSMKNYSVPWFMEDWYHSKTKHFKQKNDYAWFLLNHKTKCVNVRTCAHTQRHQRIRGRETYNINSDIDHKNIILTDQINSIHTYIFHSCSFTAQLRNNIRFVDSHDDNTDIKEDIKEEQTISPLNKVKEASVWSNKPKSVNECNVNQIVYILKNEHLFDTLDKLGNYKEQIL
eukprot:99694_1